jgi:rubredoxin
LTNVEVKEVSEKSTCPAKHTKFQPTMEQWRCPLCGNDAQADFIVDDPDPDAEDFCELLHEKDVITCVCNDEGWTGKQIAAKLAKKLDMVTCPCCKGAGLISSKDAKLLGDASNDSGL